MMKLKVCNLLIILFGISAPLLGQYNLKGVVKESNSQKPIKNAEIFIKKEALKVNTEDNGSFIFKELKKADYTVVIFALGYNSITKNISLLADTSLTFILQPFDGQMDEVVISQKQEESFGLNRLNPIEGTSIYAGKKSEVILMDQAIGNLAANNARQIYSQVVGLNIYDNGDAGLQLNVGGRGLDPNRTANFNTRQNGYDISADVLGYPESYYTPPAEAIQQIEVIRGAASLQYGTQFGGLINFKLREPNPNKKIEWNSRQSYGSFNLFTSFNSLSGTIGRFSYYTHFNYKREDGFRPNSGFDSKNFFASLDYALTDQTNLTFETTYSSYLAQQPGGLTDSQFNENMYFSNRERNWFSVDWKLFALKLKHKFSPQTKMSLNLFGLDAQRDALGFRGDAKRPERNPITEPDDPDVYTRDLIVGKFNNWGAEARLLHHYSMFKKKSVFLVGVKYYQSANSSIQGPGSPGYDADFSFTFESNPSYPNQSDFSFPNLNLALFSENILNLSDNLSITPGMRIEYIKTESTGNYTEVRYDLAGNEIFRETRADNRTLERPIILFGLGVDFYHSEQLELYANLSQNYRSVTFSDIRVVNPTFMIDPDITDEKGFTGDVGIRGKYDGIFSYDVSLFALRYNNRIGTILVSSGPNKGNRVRKNIGDAFIYGLETFVDWNVINTIHKDMNLYKFAPFVNFALTNSQYLSSEESNVEGKMVEFIPQINLKTGIRLGYKNLLGSLQYTFLSDQFTDAQNSSIPDPGESTEGIIGKIPSYDILDFSLSYAYKAIKLESGINNLLNEKYFTRRATGYPGPGIIPSAPRTYYITLGFRI
ncbi:TonB-dependent receptor domain-containing protein [Flexithrix dorotheae]|uniref:TonB-dependent receptor domain-containing protein n=1 Tax=Flexithrix dorotheae TaxID=70993 RepID=UPI001B7F8613|nr:TonB-dependent receptor [Flexithrix dorotheae]